MGSPDAIFHRERAVRQLLACPTPVTGIGVNRYRCSAHRFPTPLAVSRAEESSVGVIGFLRSPIPAKRLSSDVAARDIFCGRRCGERRERANGERNYQPASNHRRPQPIQNWTDTNNGLVSYNKRHIYRQYLLVIFWRLSVICNRPDLASALRRRGLSSHRRRPQSFGSEATASS